MNVDDFALESGEWLKGTGPQSDIVVSSRIRLARNLCEFPFVRRCNDFDRAQIESLVHTRVMQQPEFSHLCYVDVADLETLDRQFLVERQLISRELADAKGARSVVIGDGEQFSVMINEEDHLRIQVMKSGFDVHEAYRQIDQIEERIDSKLPFAYHERLGYLTACPTNVGTGMRVSVMLHLPALVITRQFEKVLRSLQKINLVVRGLYGEGSQAMGDFYQISNHITLGRSETKLVEHVANVIPSIVGYERKAREYLIAENRFEVRDQVLHACETLRSVEQISSEETMLLLSKVRMGINLGIVNDIGISTVNKLFIQTQPAHLQKLCRSHLETCDRNIERAHFIQSILNN